ncbi:Uncharacterised protein [Mycobacteroides abscessus subsp. massiliense]|nr:Uncharacterised protein [Mycobacteroides abscessus subsp. massiliense]
MRLPRIEDEADVLVAVESPDQYEIPAPARGNEGRDPLWVKITRERNHPDRR